MAVIRTSVGGAMNSNFVHFCKMFRIQKLLLAEYEELYETVLVESPFAEVTEEGVGVKQVQLGLTPTKLIVGQDVFEGNATCCPRYVPLVEKDPEIECFQLTSMMPLNELRISFYKKRKRIIMSVKILEGRTLFYEFGGYLSRNLFWNIWRERIATLRQMGTNLFNISASSPFSSTDVIPDEEEVIVSIHPSPRNYLSSDYEATSYPHPDVRTLYKRYSSTFTDVIQKASSSSSQLSVSDSRHQFELETYFHSLSVTNSFSCGCNRPW